MNKIGRLGEDLVCRYLVNHGHIIVEKNAGYKAGEIDIVSKKDGVYHFTEVKSKTVPDFSQESLTRFRPEEKVNEHKQRQIRNAVEIYLSAHKVGEFQINVASVFINTEDKQVKVEMLENVIV